MTDRNYELVGKRGIGCNLPCPLGQGNGPSSCAKLTSRPPSLGFEVFDDYWRSGGSDGDGGGGGAG